MLQPNVIAAIIHADMCNDDRNGYSWDPRTGGDHWDGVKTLEIDGRSYSYKLGSWDCSSSFIACWKLALMYTKYAGILDDASYTGNIRNVFERSGLFDVWDTSSTSAETGDGYLNDEHHVAMCQDGSPDNDILSEFCINENGEVYGGQVGDQTGYEAYIHWFYEYWAGWWCTLHWNHVGDDSFIDMPDNYEPEPVEPPEKPTNVKHAKYLAMVDEEWLPRMVDHEDSGGSDDTWAGVMGNPIEYFACNYSKYRVLTEESLELYNNGESKSKWLDWIHQYNLDDLVNGAAGDGTPILYLQVNSNHVELSAHTLDGEWLDAKKVSGGWRVGNGKPLDAVSMKWV